MSLDVYLTLDQPITTIGTGVFIREGGGQRELTLAEVREKFPDADVSESERSSEYVYSRNITHNLNTMADAAGIYKHLWRPDEIGITKAEQLIAPLSSGLVELMANPEKYKAFNPPNGWGDYGGLVEFVREYLEACKAHPSATVSVSR